MNSLLYNQLETDDSIRLFHLCAGRHTDDLICKLFVSYTGQDKGLSYKALSYTWGRDEGPGVCIVVNGYHFRANNNLVDALRQIRRRDKDVILWVDAICINQADKREKGHQVKQMSRIYAEAEEVLIWLGLSISGTASVMDWVDVVDKQAITSDQPWQELYTQLARESLGNCIVEDLSLRRKVFADLLGRPWFTRVWILQEVANARAARILCGTHSCSARAFALMPSLLGVKVSEHIQAVLDIMPRVRKDSWYSSERYLHVLLRKFAGSHAEEPRDNIYALLGMSEDACSPTRFYPCYEKDDYKVFRDTASFLLFGEVLDTSYAFHRGKLDDLRQPLTGLAERVLLWALHQCTDIACRATVQLLLDRLNAGELKMPDLASTLVEYVKQADNVQLPLDKDVTISAQFEDDSTTLYLSSRFYPSPSVALDFNREQLLPASEGSTQRLKRLGLWSPMPMMRYFRLHSRSFPEPYSRSVTPIARSPCRRLRVAKGRVTKGRVAKGRVAKGRVAKGRVAKGRVAKGRVDGFKSPMFDLLKFDSSESDSSESDSSESDSPEFEWSEFRSTFGGDAERLQRLEPPHPRLTNSANPDEAIQDLIRGGASKEELLRAYAWAGDVAGMERQRVAGAQINAVDERGNSVLVYAVAGTYAWLSSGSG